jgi:hypothetical protein
VDAARTAPEPIEYAQHAVRCAHIKYNGESCGCPALKGQRFCRFHNEAENFRDLALPFVGDAASLQVAIMRVIRLIEMEMIDGKKASAALYALQLASANLARLSAEMPIDPAAAGQSVTTRILRILDPPLEKYALVMQRVSEIVALL